MDLKKVLAERVLNAEMDHHLAGQGPDNRRNGYSKKTVVTDTRQIAVSGECALSHGQSGEI
jgi:putative transposase